MLPEPPKKQGDRYQAKTLAGTFCCCLGGVSCGVEAFLGCVCGDLGGAGRSAWNDWLVDHGKQRLECGVESLGKGICSSMIRPRRLSKLENRWCDKNHESFNFVDVQDEQERQGEDEKRSTSLSLASGRLPQILSVDRTGVFFGRNSTQLT